MVKFTINGKELEAKEGTTVLEAAIDAGIKIPYLCYHKELSTYGACRVCLVEVTKRSWTWLEPACLFRVFDGLIVKTDTERVKKTRDIVFELLLARCPDSGKIKSLAAEYGVIRSRFKYMEKKENCILCGLCFRACSEVSKRHAISFANRGRKRKIQTPFFELSKECIGCGACAYICPTGVIKIEEAE